MFKRSEKCSTIEHRNELIFFSVFNSNLLYGEFAALLANDRVVHRKVPHKQALLSWML